MRPPGAKRGAAPFGSAESHELRSWARLRAGGLRPCPLPSPSMLTSPAAFAPSPPAPTQTPALTKPLSPTPPQTQKLPPSQNTRPSPAPPRPLRGRPCPLPSPMLSLPAAFSPSPAPLQLPPTLPTKNSPAAFHRLRGSVHLWYFVPALMAQARYSCSHSSTRAS